MQKPQELPQEYQNYMEQDGLERVVLDYISGMTDRYCIARFEEISCPRCGGNGRRRQGIWQTEKETRFGHSPELY